LAAAAVLGREPRADIVFLLPRTEKACEMRYAETICRIVRWTASCLVCWFVGVEAALAASKPPAPPPEKTGSAMDYTLPYAVVILAMGLGVFAVLRPSRRQERARPEQYVEKNILVRGD